MSEETAMAIVEALATIAGGEPLWPCVECGCLLDPLDQILGQWCSPECAEADEACPLCKAGPSWCECGWECGAPGEGE